MDQGHKNMPYLESRLQRRTVQGRSPRSTTSNWTTIGPSFSSAWASYDFRDEVNVEVLGHLFEKSVAEMERLRPSELSHPLTGRIAKFSPLPLGEGQGVRAVDSPADSPHPSPLQGRGADAEPSPGRRAGIRHAEIGRTQAVRHLLHAVGVHRADRRGNRQRRSSGERFEALLAVARSDPRAERGGEAVAQGGGLLARLPGGLARHQGLRPGLRQRRVPDRRLRRPGRTPTRGGGPLGAARRARTPTTWPTTSPT